MATRESRDERRDRSPERRSGWPRRPQKVEPASAEAAPEGRAARRPDRAHRQLRHLDAAGTGSRKPRFSRDDIARAALRIADAEGFDALSMRRLAAELDAGTMTLYHYVRPRTSC